MRTQQSDECPRQRLGSLVIAILTISILAATTTVAADGAAIYAKKCKSCHGATGNANTKMGKKLKCRDLTKASVQDKLTDAQIAKSITHGVTENGKVRMKPIKNLNSADIKAVTKYVRTLNKK